MEKKIGITLATYRKDKKMSQIELADNLLWLKCSYNIRLDLLYSNSIPSCIPNFVLNVDLF